MRARTEATLRRELDARPPPTTAPDELAADAPRVAIYARVSTHDQQTLPEQLGQLEQLAARRGWRVVARVTEVGSGVKRRPEREKLRAAARRRDVDIIAVWRLDRWGRSLVDLVGSLHELAHLGVSFVSHCEALDLTTPAGRALVGMLAVFAEFERELIRERVRAGVAAARAAGRRLGRPPTAFVQLERVRELAALGTSPNKIARQLRMGRTSVRRLLLDTTTAAPPPD